MTDVQNQIIKSLRERITESKDRIKINEERNKELADDIIKLYDCIKKIKVKGEK